MHILTLLQNAWNAEIKPSEKYRYFFTNSMLGYAFITTAYGTMPLLGDIKNMEQTLQGEPEFFAKLLSFKVLLPLFILTVVCNFLLTITSYTHQKKFFGNDMPMEHAAYQLSNLLLLATTALILIIPSILLISLFSWSFEDAQNWLSIFEQHIVTLPSQLDKIPTLINFPPEVAFLSATIMNGFGAYWWHRLAHAWRPMWMLIHRPHHVPERISQLTSIFTDDVAFGGLLKRITVPVVQAVIAKLFTHDSTTVIEIIAVWFLLSFAFRYALEPISHSIIFYDWSVRHKWVKLGCFAFFSGPYHLMHHSNKKEHQVVNLSFTPFYIWDIVFGTYVNPGKERPETGLTNSPKIYMNPIRIIFSGWVEMYMEFKINKNWKDRILILFGSTSYTPPIRFSYLKK